MFGLIQTYLSERMEFGWFCLQTSQMLSVHESHPTATWDFNLIRRSARRKKNENDENMQDERGEKRFS